jgi:iron-sulfur cluster repair protein YtfE (RIC family)
MADEQKSPTDGRPPRGRFTIVYMIHEAFRRDLTRLSAALRSPGVDQYRARQLGAHWAFIEDQLHHHHEVEDASLWPLVRPKLSGQDEQLGVLAEMEAQHKELLPQCAAIGNGFASLVQQPGAEAGSALAGNLDALGAELGSHLEDEEQRCFPVIDQALTAEEFESFGKATAKAVGMRGSAKFFPWIFDTANPVERKAVLSMPPPPVRVLCQYVWEPRYTRKVASLWTD